MRIGKKEMEILKYSIRKKYIKQTQLQAWARAISLDRSPPWTVLSMSTRGGALISVPSASATFADLNRSSQISSITCWGLAGGD